VHLATYLAVAVAGVFAGAVNTIAGAGSLLTYPVLIAVGLSPLAANVTNDLGVLPGNISGAIGLRSNLAGQGELLRRVVPRAIVGSVLGAVLLLVAPSSFGWAAPPLVILASAVTLAQPMLLRHRPPTGQRRRPFHLLIDLISIYGGYFGTGIGLLFFASMTAFIPEPARRLNAMKNVLQSLSNGVAGLLFALVAPVHWTFAATMAGGSLVGGQLGAWTAGRIPNATLRVVAAVVGLVAGGWLLARQFGLHLG
jgi:uncharacterized membrane protein YfcA